MTEAQDLQSIELKGSQQLAEPTISEQPQIEVSETPKIPEQHPKTPENSVKSKETNETEGKNLTQQVPGTEASEHSDKISSLTSHVNQTSIDDLNAKGDDGQNLIQSTTSEELQTLQAKNKVRQLAEKIIGEPRTTKIINYIGESTLIKFGEGLKKAALGALGTTLVLFGACWMIGGSLTGSFAIGAVVGLISLIGAAAAYAKLAQLMAQCKELQGTVENCQKNCQEMQVQNQQIQEELSGAQQTLAEQRATIDGLKENNEQLKNDARTAQDAVNELVEGYEKQLKEKDTQISEIKKESDEKISEIIKGNNEKISEIIQEKDTKISEQEEIIKEKTQEIKEKEQDIVRLMSENAELKAQVDVYCNAFKGLVTSQEQAIQNLKEQFDKQVETTNIILSNVQEIANGEQELTEALKWAQEKIAEGQKLLGDIATLSVDMTNTEKIASMISDGTLVKNAQQIQEKTQAANKILSELSTGLSERIINAQTKISQHRQAAAEEVQRLQKEIDESKSTILKQEEELKKQKEVIEDKEKEIQKKTESRQKLHAKAIEVVDQAKDIIKEQKETIADKDAKNAELNEDIRKAEVAKAKLDGALKDMETRLQEQKDLLGKLEAEHQQLLQAHEKMAETTKTQAETIQQQQELQQELYTQAMKLQQQLENAQQSAGRWLGFGSAPKWLVTAAAAAGALVLTSNPAALAAGGAALFGAAVGSKQ